NFFVGDANGKEITSQDCNADQPKYLYIYIPSKPKRYSLYAEYVYTITKPNNEKIVREVAQCYYSKEVIPDSAQLTQIEWSCGDRIEVERVNLTFSNNKDWTCNQGPSPKCYTSNDVGMI